MLRDIIELSTNENRSNDPIMSQYHSMLRAAATTPVQLGHGVLYLYGVATQKKGLLKTYERRATKYLTDSFQILVDKLLIVICIVAISPKWISSY